MFKRWFQREQIAGPGRALGREFSVGDVIEQRFEIQQVRRGYMGIVYVAYDRTRRKRVVLKTFQNKFLWDDRAISRFNAEVQLWMRLGSHPHIVRAYDVRQIIGKPHVVAEYVEGGPLRALIGHLRLEEALDYAIQICWGMQYAGERLSLLHCDLKPDNVLVTINGPAKVTDFGLSRLMPSWQHPFTGERIHRQTNMSDGPAGTLPYMAPEMFEQLNQIGIWSDIYSFGVMFFELLTGHLPFDSNRDESLIRMHMHQPPPDPRNFQTQLPSRLVNIVLTCLAKEPADRYQTFDEVARDLQQARYELFGATKRDYWETGDGVESQHWRERGQAHVELGEYKDAVYAFLRAIQIVPDSADAWISLAQARLRLWQYNEAQQAIDQGLRYATNRNEFGALYQTQGEVYTAMHRPREAVEAYDKGLSYTPSSPGLWREKGSLLLRVGMPKDATTCLQKAVKYDHFDAPARRLLGDALAELGQFRSACSSYSEALRLDPRSAEGWAKLGKAQLKLKYYREARDSFQHALVIDPDLQEAMDGMRQANAANKR